ncbi:MAG: DUF4405 domain-containing protein [Caldilineales bacterium]|nr:DUF4405 domain-containing protein [Caldilineales bacterium]
MPAKTNLTLDLIIFTAFVAVANPALTGMTIHEWLALAFGAAIITHLLFHWNWIAAITRKFFHKLWHQSRLNYVVNLAFFVAVTATMLSGVLISKSALPILGIDLHAGQQWKMIHTLAADASLILLGLHFALHIKWVVFNLKKHIVTPVIRLIPRQRTRSLAAQTRIDG